MYPLSRLWNLGLPASCAHNCCIARPGILLRKFKCKCCFQWWSIISWGIQARRKESLGHGIGFFPPPFNWKWMYSLQSSLEWCKIHLCLVLCRNSLRTLVIIYWACQRWEVESSKLKQFIPNGRQFHRNMDFLCLKCCVVCVCVREREREREKERAYLDTFLRSITTLLLPNSFISCFLKIPRTLC